MAENSKIEWTDHTFNPWIGCTKVSPACDHCYAEALDKRWNGGERWGPHAIRTRTSAANWKKPLQWDRKAEQLGVRYRVFCASLADVFDNHKSIEPKWRLDLFDLIEDTPNLDWLLLTKRPQNALKFFPVEWAAHGAPRNVWIGTTVENQEEYDRRIGPLERLPAEIKFLSMEPLLGPVDLGPDRLVDWVIVGGESGPDYRPADLDWFRSLRDQCARLDIPFLFKQHEGKSQPAIKAKGRALDGIVHDGYPRPNHLQEVF